MVIVSTHPLLPNLNNPTMPITQQDRDAALSQVTSDELVREMIRRIDPEHTRPGLKDTPDRVVRMWTELFSGYYTDPKELFTVFEEPYDQIVIVRGVDFWSTCEHHLLPFFGTADIGYIPGVRGVVGLSKLARVVDVFARRLQVQERMTEEIRRCIDSNLIPKGTMVVVQAKHLCLGCRGARKQNATMVTSSLSGEFEAAEVRAEFLELARR